MENASPEQIEKAFRLCDMLGLEDFTLAFSILQQLDWSIEKAVQVIQDINKNTPSQPKPDPPELPPNYTGQENESESDHENNEYLYNEEEEVKNKRRMFDEAYEEIKLDRSTTEPPTKLEKRLSYDRHIIEDFSNYRHTYQVQLLQDSQKFCKKLLGGKIQKMRSIDQSKVKNENNRSFICYLSKNYRCAINFTFGTFFLNLARSYLDKKFLLVYIHQMEHEDSRSLRMILFHKEITKFINSNCVSYGMFDNSDDYDILQKYVPIKDLPAFALFKYSKKTRKQQFLASYQVLQKSPENFIEWLANHTGVVIKKKQKETKTNYQQKKDAKRGVDFSHRDIMSKQNQEYEQMERIYHLRRQQSKIKKEEIENAEKAIENMRQRFINQPKLDHGKTIEIKFRLPETGKSIVRVFELKNKIKEMFDYVNCFGRDQFEQRYAQFDLTQTFPRLSLLDSQMKDIGEIFSGSDHQNIIVKEL